MKKSIRLRIKLVDHRNISDGQTRKIKRRNITVHELNLESGISDTSLPITI